MPELTESEYNLSLVELDGYRCPVTWELVRHVIPALMAVFFFGLFLGYSWARAAYQFIR